MRGFYPKEYHQDDGDNPFNGYPRRWDHLSQVGEKWNPASAQRNKKYAGGDEFLLLSGL
jgi:hypothetical protein